MNSMLGMTYPTTMPYDYSVPVAVERLREDAQFVASLIETKAFQRLKDIRFLGGIDYLLVRRPNGNRANVRYTRYQHSLGVLFLVSLYCARLQFAQKERRLAYAAALLHDIGHAPLSHSLEPVFKQNFGLDHHGATEDIVLGKVEIGLDVRTTLTDFDVSPDDVVAILSGKTDPCAGFFGGPINFDTIEGILRSLRYLGLAELGQTPPKILYAAMDRATIEDKKAVDKFWLLKDQVYSQLIRSREGVTADYVCQGIAIRNIERIKKSDYFLSEAAMFRRLPELRDAINLGVSGAIEKFDLVLPETYNSRSFYLDDSSNFFDRNDIARYRQEKTLRGFSIHLNIPHKGMESQMDFLDTPII